MATGANLHLPQAPTSMMQLDAVMQLDVVLPSQHFAPRAKQAPEQRLMIAVFHDAFECIEKYRFATNADGRRLFREALRWFLVDETDWPYSFESICGVLDIDANAVRQRLGVVL